MLKPGTSVNSGFASTTPQTLLPSKVLRAGSDTKVGVPVNRGEAAEKCYDIVVKESLDQIHTTRGERGQGKLEIEWDI